MTPSIEAIKRHVAASFGVERREMDSRRKSLAVARPRQVAMFLAKRLTARSLAEIGRAFGGRDHTTVMHAIQRIEELIRSDPDFAGRVAEVEASAPADLGLGGEDLAEDLEEAANQARRAAVRRAKTESGCGVAGPADDLRRALVEVYGERPMARGVSRDGAAIEILASPEGTWSIIEGIEGAEGAARLAAAGREWSVRAAPAPAPAAPAAPVAPTAMSMPAAAVKPPLPAPPKRRARSCLKCSRNFSSAGPGNRVCKTCRKALDGVNKAMAEGVSA